MYAITIKKKEVMNLKKKQRWAYRRFLRERWEERNEYIINILKIFTYNYKKLITKKAQK